MGSALSVPLSLCINVLPLSVVDIPSGEFLRGPNPLIPYSHFTRYMI